MRSGEVTAIRSAPTAGGVVALPLLWWRFKAGQLISLFLLHGGLIVPWLRRRRLKKTEGGERGCVT